MNLFILGNLLKYSYLVDVKQVCFIGIEIILRSQIDVYVFIHQFDLF